MKNFKIISQICEGGTIEGRGFKRLLEAERVVDFGNLSLSSRRKNDIIDDFEDGFNDVIEDENGKLYEAAMYYGMGVSEPVPVVYREVKRA